MKSFLKLAVSVIPLIVLAGCGADTATNLPDYNVEKYNQEELEPEQTPSVKQVGAFTYSTSRKVEVQLGGRGEVINLNQYRAGFNKRVINIEQDGDPLDNGAFKCVDLTNPTQKSEEEEVKFSINGKSAQMNIQLGESNKLERTYNCSVYENNKLVSNSETELKFYSDIFVEGKKLIINLDLLQIFLTE